MSRYACPACASGLNKNANGALNCSACNITFPRLDKVEFLWADPGSALHDWRNRLNRELAEIEEAASRANAAMAQVAPSQDVTAANSGANSQTIDRIARLASGSTELLAQLNEILQPLKVGEALARETHLALQTKLASHHGVLSYAPNIFRDWCWGAQENQRVREHLTTVLADQLPQGEIEVLVLGAGAGRLAYDLHETLDARTVALDSNPLLCLIGEAMSEGKTVELTEFPNAPIGVDDSVILQTLSAPHASKSRLSFVCADALRVPFAAGSFDVIVTPWLLDVMDANLQTFIESIGTLLKPGGLWLNHGSVAFSGADPLRRFTAPELAELSRRLGFEVLSQADTELPYLHSPNSRQQRTEIVYTLLCQWQHAATGAAVPKQHQLPPWIAEDRTPVPLSQSFQSQITTVRVHAFIMSLIDGKRSIQDMAQLMEEQRLMPQGQAKQALRQFLTTMHEEAVREAGGQL